MREPFGSAHLHVGHEGEQFPEERAQLRLGDHVAEAEVDTAAEPDVRGLSMTVLSQLPEQ